MSPVHPLQLLNDSEIKAASSILLKHIAEIDKNRGNGKQTKVHFKNLSLHDPPKHMCGQSFPREYDAQAVQLIVELGCFHTSTPKLRVYHTHSAATFRDVWTSSGRPTIKERSRRALSALTPRR